MSVSYRVNAAKVVAKRELFSTLYGLGLYVTMLLVFLFSSYAVSGTVFQLEQNGLEALPTPISSPFFLSVSLISIYLGLCSAIAVSRERDGGTLEVLFYGPVDSISYIIGKYAQQILTFAVTLVFSVIHFFLVSQVTNFGFSDNFVGLLLLSFFLASCMVAFGIFLSTLTQRTTISVAVFIALMAGLLIFPYARSWVMSIPGKELTTILVYARIVLDKLNLLVQWISPVAYFQRGSMAVELGNTTQYLTSLAASAGYSLVLLAISIRVFENKGVRK